MTPGILGAKQPSLRIRLVSISPARFDEESVAVRWSTRDRQPQQLEKKTLSGGARQSKLDAPSDETARRRDYGDIEIGDGKLVDDPFRSLAARSCCAAPAVTPRTPTCSANSSGPIFFVAA